MPEGTLEKVLKIIAKNSALFLVVLGTALALLGANAGFNKWGLIVPTVYWRVFLAVLGLTMGGFGVRLIWRGQGEIDTASIARECELRIESPGPGDNVGEEFEVRGAYKKKPPKTTPVAIIERTPSGRHWFKELPIQFREKDKKWSTTIHVGGNKEKRTLSVAILGEAGQCLRDYFIYVHDKFKQSAGIPSLTSDIATCDEVEVNFGGGPKPGQEYGLKITSPQKTPTQKVGERISLNGTYLRQPPTDKHVAIIEFVPRDQDYWFQGPVRLQDNNTWSADIEIGGVHGMDRVLQLAVLGSAGQALMEYFQLVADKKAWVGVRTLPPDTLICDEVKVYFS